MFDVNNPPDVTIPAGAQETCASGYSAVLLSDFSCRAGCLWLDRVAGHYILFVCRRHDDSDEVCAIFDTIRDMVEAQCSPEDLLRQFPFGRIIEGRLAKGESFESRLSVLGDLGLVT